MWNVCPVNVKIADISWASIGELLICIIHIYKNVMNYSVNNQLYEKGWQLALKQLIRLFKMLVVVAII